MRVISSFDHSIYLELALTALEEHGIEKRSILAVPLEKAAEKPKLLDSIHRSDGTSLIDIGAACATALTVIASSIGFILHWGPIIWGLIGAAAGFIIGVLVDWLLKRQKSNQRKSQVIKGKSTEVIVVIDCEAHQMEAVEATLWKHMAFGVAKLQ
ncbi:hypothetical protein K0U00_16295 [Paenibacillus sepulcri]|uniref:Uncharacterized protein n=2 Tax=Paenibacillus sepulcri TaxID=359917 RepID=A0ABS7C3V5_9BACL|nr:hypothetical protein [Paenibacillus sepulcri]